MCAHVKRIVIEILHVSSYMHRLQYKIGANRVPWHSLQFKVVCCFYNGVPPNSYI